MTVNDRIKAVHVLQRFVKMSRNLLVNFTELMSKENPSKGEEQKINRIKGVYETFRVNSDISENLVNSNIFQLIKDVYQNAILKNGQTPENLFAYDAFVEESDRLIATWEQQGLN